MNPIDLNAPLPLGYHRAIQQAIEIRREHPFISYPALSVFMARAPKSRATSDATVEILPEICRVVSMQKDNTCACGCEGAVTPGRKFISGHNRRAPGTVAPVPMPGIPLRQYFNSTLRRWYVALPDGSRQFRYRYLAEQMIGRSLEPGEHVHHINGDQGDDRVENLQVVTSAEHQVLHGTLRPSAIRLMFLMADAGFKQYEIAEHLGVTQSVVSWRLREHMEDAA